MLPYFQKILNFTCGDKTDDNSQYGLLRRVLCILLFVFLPIIIAGYMYTKLPSQFESISSSDNYFDVVVLGAGISGLASAEAYRGGVTNFAVFDVNNRLGGRLKNVRFGNSVVSLGGGWIHRIDNEEMENPVWELARENMLRVHWDDYKELTYR